MRARKMLRLGTRGSDLALWQAHYVSDHLSTDTKLHILKTEGDERTQARLDQIEGIGFFTTEIEMALLQDEVDVAVHSYKDLPTVHREGLHVSAVPTRAPVGDVLIFHTKHVDENQRWTIAKNVHIGTSSLRRRAMLASLRPDLKMEDMRGNVPTRIEKLLSGQVDGIVLAEAGLRRLGLLNGLKERGLDFHLLPVEDICPAPSQGALAIQVRSTDTWATNCVAELHDHQSGSAVQLERSLLARFGGGCHLPLGVYVELSGSVFQLRALVAAPDGSERLEVCFSSDDGESLVEKAYQSLIQQGAQRYL
jgi:hydroxymethylbilane synthase